MTHTTAANLVVRLLGRAGCAREESTLSTAILSRHAPLIDGIVAMSCGGYRTSNIPWVVYQARTRDSTSGSVAISA